MRFIIYVLIFAWSGPLWAQSGNYFLSHYEPNDGRADNVCFDIEQDNQGILYFATKVGVQQFDGRNWTQLNGIGAIYTLNITEAGEIFWGGAHGFGKFNHDKNDVIKSIRLSNAVVTDVFQSIRILDEIYFLSDKGVFVFSTKNSKTVHIKSNNLTGSFTGLFELFGQAYVNTERGGVFSIKKNALVKSNIELPTEISFTSKFEHSYLIGTLDNRVFICSDNLKFHEIKLEDQEYVNAGVIISASWINKQLVALGMLRGGVIFINPLTGKTKELVNYNTGLPDNEVFSMMSDRHQNIWIAHDYGFTRVAPYLPLHSFNHYEGLQGNLLCSISFKQQVYVGTSLGLFKLEKEEVFDEIISYEEEPEKKKPVNKEKTPEPVKVTPEKQPEVEIGSKKKGLFSFLKRKKTIAPVDEIKDEPVVKKTDEESSGFSLFKRKPKRKKITQKRLRSLQYVYKRVKGIHAKVTQLINVQDKLIAAGLGGAYEVNGLETKSVLDEPIRFIFANKNLLLASTYQDEIRSWSLNGKAWIKSNVLDNLDDEISFIFEGKENELWLCALDKLYKLDVNGNEVKNIQSIELPNENLAESIGTQYKGNTVIVNAGGFYGYNRNKGVMVKLDTLPVPNSYFADSKNLWYRNTHGWNLLGNNTDRNNLQLLNLFQDLRFIASDQSSNNLWLITGDNELFKFFGEKLRPYETGYPLLIKSIQNGDTKITNGKIKIDERQSALTVEVVQPDYISGQSMEYRYFLKGLEKTWSEWSANNNIVNFPYLPPGKYTLGIQAKDIFGKVSEIEALSITVQPPYWQRPWFYALEFGVFALLVMASFRLSSKYVIVSRLLSLLTIILLIQFIQTVINAYFTIKGSPVFDFFIQVIVAFLILPVEGYLRKLMVRSIDANEIYQLISKKKES